MAKYRADVVGLGKWEQDVRTRSVRVVRDALLQLNASIIDEAPVRTGFMVDSALVGLNGDVTPSEVDRPRGFSAPDAQESKMAEIAAVVRTMSLKDTFRLAFIAKYTRLVHEGTSSMAARPFIAQAAWQWEKFLRRAVAKYKSS